MDKRLGIALAILLAISLIGVGVLGYMWGHTNAEVRSLKEEKKQYLTRQATRDSLIAVYETEIIVLTDSMNTLYSDGLTINTRADNRLVRVNKDKDKMHEEIRNVNNLTADSLLRLFNREADDYQPR